jgi:hypothetical protein
MNFEVASAGAVIPLLRKWWEEQTTFGEMGIRWSTIKPIRLLRKPKMTDLIELADGAQTKVTCLLYYFSEQEQNSYLTIHGLALKNIGCITISSALQLVKSAMLGEPIIHEIALEFVPFPTTTLTMPLRERITASDLVRYLYLMYRVYRRKENVIGLLKTIPTDARTTTALMAFVLAAMAPKFRDTIVAAYCAMQCQIFDTHCPTTWDLLDLADAQNKVVSNLAVSGVLQKSFGCPEWWRNKGASVIVLGLNARAFVFFADRAFSPIAPYEYAGPDIDNLLRSAINRLAHLMPQFDSSMSQLFYAVKGTIALSVTINICGRCTETCSFVHPIYYNGMAILTYREIRSSLSAVEHHHVLRIVRTIECDLCTASLLQIHSASSDHLSWKQYIDEQYKTIPENLISEKAKLDLFGQVYRRHTSALGSLLLCFGDIYHYLFDPSVINAAADLCEIAEERSRVKRPLVVSRCPDFAEITKFLPPCLMTIADKCNWQGHPNYAQRCLFGSFLVRLSPFNTLIDGELSTEEQNRIIRKFLDVWYPLFRRHEDQQKREEFRRNFAGSEYGDLMVKDFVRLGQKNVMHSCKFAFEHRLCPYAGSSASEDDCSKKCTAKCLAVCSNQPNGPIRTPLSYYMAMLPS